jgi:hypothetical protein
MPLIYHDADREDVADTTDVHRCYCESCKFGRLENNKLRHVVIRNYSYKPTLNFKKLPNDKYHYYMGVELETDNYSGRGNYSQVRNAYAASMKRPIRFWVAKTDSSVTGPEFASHPATLDYWHSKKHDLADMFKMLTHAGFRSYENGSCGIHVNISNNAFEDAKHLYRFMTLIHIRPSWSLRMSQRTYSQAAHWATLDGLDRTSYRKRVSEAAVARNGNGRPVTDKYTAVHIPNYYGDSNRIEFRLPRGTLRLDRFYKNLEWTAGMIEFTRGSRRMLECTPIKFMAWCRDNKREFPNLVAFLNEKFPA